MKTPTQLARQEIKRAVRLGLITTEAEADAIAWKHLPGIPHYEVTGVVHPLLPKTLKEVIDKAKYRHPWFKGKVTRTVYEDVWGRVWNKTTGIVKKGIKLYRLRPNKIWIDLLGGMSWDSTDGKHFVCEWRTNREEFARSKKGPSPETFVG